MKIVKRINGEAKITDTVSKVEHPALDPHSPTVIINILGYNLLLCSNVADVEISLKNRL